MGVPRGLIVLLMIAMCLCRSTYADVECRDGKIYQQCGTCPTTCEQFRRDECPLPCNQGCFCPSGSVLDSNGVCVKEQQCGCLHVDDSNGEKDMYHKIGEHFKFSGSWCVCNSRDKGLPYLSCEDRK